MKTVKFSIRSLGCKVNQYEEQLMRESLHDLGLEETDPSGADVVIINSCTVTAQADVKTRKLIKKISNGNPGVRIVVTGCYAVLEEDIGKISGMPEVDHVFPGNMKEKLPYDLCRELGVDVAGGVVNRKGISGFRSRTRAFLKIQDGCDRRCSYCKVNVVRGPSRSKHEDDIIEELQGLLGAGYGEVVLTGVCLGSWKGSSGMLLPGLIKRIDAIDGRFRVRLSSLEPDHDIDEIVDAMASSGKICRHLHIPLQSGSDRILKSMNRTYSRNDFFRLCDKIRGKMPDIGLTMDVICGFPGEKQEDHDLTCKLIDNIRPSRLHVFKYSERVGTPAASMGDKVDPGIASERVSQLIDMGNVLQLDFCRDFLHREVEVLVESSAKDGFLEGYTGEYVRVRLGVGESESGKFFRTIPDKIDETEKCLISVKPRGKTRS